MHGVCELSCTSGDTSCMCLMHDREKCVMNTNEGGTSKRAEKRLCHKKGMYRQRLDIKLQPVLDPTQSGHEAT